MTMKEAKGLTREEAADADGVHVVLTDDGDMEVIHDGSLGIDEIDGEVVASGKATEVDYDPATGEWFSILKDGREICRDRCRRAVVRKEHAILADMVGRGERIPADGIASALARSARRWTKRALAALKRSRK